MYTRHLAALLLVAGVACGTPTAAPPTPRPTVARTASAAPSPVVTTAPPRPTKAAALCRYVFPVQPASAASYGSSHHDYPATDIFAPLGTNAVSPVDGVVNFISRTDEWDPANDDPAKRGGLSVAIIGEDGVRYYGSHLRDFTAGLNVGDRISAGDVFGHVGQTGNARGIAAHLHFGISQPTTPDDWSVRRGVISPFPYLNDWKKGTPNTPDVTGADPASCARV